MPIEEMTAPPVDGELDTPDSVENESDIQNPPDYGENNKDLPEVLVRALKTLVRTYQGQEKYDRRREVLRDWKNRLYSRGFQHLEDPGDSGGYTAAVPGGYTKSASGNQVQCPSSIRNYNIYWPFERTITSVLTQNPPGVDFQPDNPDDPEDVQGAEAADGYRTYFDRSNNVSAIQTKITRMLLLSGRVVTWTRTEPSPDKFEKDGKTPKRIQTADVYGTLESKVCILAKDLSASPYVILSDDLDVDILRSWYPDFADKIHAGLPGIGENEYERIARLGIMQGTRSQQQTGEALGHVTTRQMCFLRPAAFTSDQIKDAESDDTPTEDDEPGRPATIRQQLEELFPQGCRVCFIGEQYAGSWAESIDDHIAIDFPYAGDGLSRMAAMDPMVVIQDDFNDDHNAFWEISNYGWPRRWLDCEDQELDAIVDQKASPYAYGAKKGRKAEPLSNQFWQEPDPTIPVTIWTRTLFLMGELAQFILAAPPSLQGNSSPDLKTASAYSQARAQAMGQQGIPWMAIQRLFAAIYRQAAKCALKDQPNGGMIVVPNEKGTPSTYDLKKLSGSFGAYPDQDSSFPESTAAKRQNLQQLLEMALQAPQIGQQIFGSPDNWEYAKNLLGASELVLPEAASRNKQLAEISELLKTSPLKPTPEEIMAAQRMHAIATLSAEKMGQPPPPPFDPDSLIRSSVPVEALDFHPFEFAKCRDFLSSEEARRIQADYDKNPGSVAGIENVRLHAMEHLQMQAKMAALMGPMQPPAPPPVVPHKGGKPNAPVHPTAAPNGAGAPSL